MDEHSSHTPLGDRSAASPLLSLEQEQAALRKGRGRMLAGILFSVLVAVGGLAALTLGSDEERVYREIGKKVNGSKVAHFDSFWACAFPGYNVRNMKNNEQLWAQLDLRASSGPSRYARHVRDTCLKQLSDMQPKFDALIPPDDLRPDVEDLSQALGRLRSAWSGLVAYLDDEQLKYDATVAQPHGMRIARGWYDFRRAHAAINSKLKNKLRR